MASVEEDLGDGMYALRWAGNRISVTSRAILTPGQSLILKSEISPEGKATLVVQGPALPEPGESLGRLTYAPPRRASGHAAGENSGPNADSAPGRHVAAGVIRGAVQTPPQPSGSLLGAILEPLPDFQAAAKALLRQAEAEKERWNQYADDSTGKTGENGREAENKKSGEELADDGVVSEKPLNARTLPDAARQTMKSVAAIRIVAEQAGRPEELPPPPEPSRETSGKREADAERPGTRPAPPSPAAPESIAQGRDASSARPAPQPTGPAASPTVTPDAAQRQPAPESREVPLPAEPPPARETPDRHAADSQRPETRPAPPTHAAHGSVAPDRAATDAAPTPRPPGHAAPPANAETPWTLRERPDARQAVAPDIAQRQPVPEKAGADTKPPMNPEIFLKEALTQLVKAADLPLASPSADTQALGVGTMVPDAIADKAASILLRAAGLTPDPATIGAARALVENNAPVDRNTIQAMLALAAGAGDGEREAVFKAAARQAARDIPMAAPLASGLADVMTRKAGVHELIDNVSEALTVEPRTPETRPLMDAAKDLLDLLRVDLGRGDAASALERYVSTFGRETLGRALALVESSAQAALENHPELGKIDQAMTAILKLSEREMIAFETGATPNDIPAAGQTGQAGQAPNTPPPEQAVAPSTPSGQAAPPASPTPPGQSQASGPAQGQTQADPRQPQPIPISADETSARPADDAAMKKNAPDASQSEKAEIQPPQDSTSRASAPSPERAAAESESRPAPPIHMGAIGAYLKARGTFPGLEGANLPPMPKVVILSPESVQPDQAPHANGSPRSPSIAADQGTVVSEAGTAPARPDPANHEITAPRPGAAQDAQIQPPPQDPARQIPRPEATPPLAPQETPPPKIQPDTANPEIAAPRPEATQNAQLQPPPQDPARQIPRAEAAPPLTPQETPPPKIQPDTANPEITAPRPEATQNAQLQPPPQDPARQIPNPEAETPLAPRETPPSKEASSALDTPSQTPPESSIRTQPRMPPDRAFIPDRETAHPDGQRSAPPAVGFDENLTMEQRERRDNVLMKLDSLFQLPGLNRPEVELLKPSGPIDRFLNSGNNHSGRADSTLRDILSNDPEKAEQAIRDLEKKDPGTLRETASRLARMERELIRQDPLLNRLADAAGTLRDLGRQLLAVKAENLAGQERNPAMMLAEVPFKLADDGGDGRMQMFYRKSKGGQEGWSSRVILDLNTTSLGPVLGDMRFFGADMILNLFVEKRETADFLSRSAEELAEQLLGKGFRVKSRFMVLPPPPKQPEIRAERPEMREEKASDALSVPGARKPGRLDTKA